MGTHVFFFIGSLHIGGTEKHLMSLLHNLDAERFRCSVACLYREGPLLSEVKALGIATYEIPFLREKGKPVAIWSLLNPRMLFDFVCFVRLLRREQVQILHSLSGITTILGPLAGRLAGVPVLVSSLENTGNWLERTVVSLDKTSQRGTLRQKLLASIRRTTYRFVNHHFVQTMMVNAEEVRNFLLAQRLIQAQKIRLIYHGVDLAEFQKLVDVATKKRELGLDPELLTVGVVATLRPVKGHQYFLRSAAQILRSGIDCQFLVVGGGELEKELRALSNELGIADRTVFAGFRQDFAEVLEVLDVSVLSSTVNEGLPDALVGSHARGKPIVAADVGGIREVVRDGISGFVVPPADADALACAISRLLKDPSLRAQMGQAGRQWVEKRFNLARVISEYEDVYAHL